ncbi:phosphotransferase family protein [Atopobacter phocae]|uniref:phosphotransferase family protein n=1 Tax=Atopobacter phocae TaxID=136492 RepID=UPI00046EB5A7|nr:phosphotransferase family protein [Atopobacter phocae]
MDYNMDSGWQLHPVGGDTGQAYMGTKENQRIFLKKNSSPFLAALSNEGITARLIWTRRAHNGDILTAQEWLEGRTLEPEDMSRPDVVDIIKNVHLSTRLLSMLEQLQGRVYEPRDFVVEFKENLHRDLQTHQWVNRVLDYLIETQDVITCYHKTVCHGDLNRKNFIETDNQSLYLVDWEKVRISDPMYDVAYVVTNYVPLNQWEAWFEQYGLEMTNSLYQRFEWFCLMNLLLFIKQGHFEGRLREVNEKIILMKHIYNERAIMDV